MSVERNGGWRAKPAKAIWVLNEITVPFLHFFLLLWWSSWQTGVCGGKGLFPLIFSGHNPPLREIMAEMKNHGGMLLIDLFFMVCSMAFLMSSLPPSWGWYCLQLSVPQNQWTIKKIHHRCVCSPLWLGQFFSLDSLFPHDSIFCQVESKNWPAQKTS